MKRNKLIIGFVLALILITNIFFVFETLGMAMNKISNEKNLSLGITINKENDIYLTGNPVAFRISIKNFSKEGVLLNRRCTVGVELLFEITKPSGIKSNLEQLIYLDPPASDDFVELKNKGSIEFTIDITNYYELDEEGQYTVKAIYQPYNGDIKEAWSGTLESNTINFLLLKKST